MENTTTNNDDRLPAKGKPPTRLQKRAPAALQLGDVNVINASVIVKCENNPSRSAIPLLSPLMLSPGPLLPLQAESVIMNDEVQACQNTGLVSTLGPVGGGGGWQHPAVVGALPEATNFFALFQSQCTLAQKSQ